MTAHEDSSGAPHAAVRGRRPGPALGREHILAEANAQFGEHGFQATTIRKIAAGVGVDAKLVHYYFGTKAELFSAVIADAFHSRGLPDLLAEQAAGAETSPGIAYVTEALSVLEHSAGGPTFIGLVRNLGTHEESRALFLKFISEELMSRLAPRLQGERPETWVALAGSQMLGLVMARYVLKISYIADLSITEVAELVGPTIDRYIVGDLG